MESEDIKIIEDIFRSVFELGDAIDVGSISRDERQNWDSMAQVALVSALDDEFDLVIAIEDAIRITSFSTCLSVVEGYLEN